MFHMERLLKKKYIWKFLIKSQWIICPPMAQKGFNEWNYWHAVTKEGGVIPLSPESLIKAAWDFRRGKPIFSS